MIFETSVLLAPHSSLGVGMHTVSTLVGSLVFAKLSGCKAVIAGPDINPAVFVAEATAAIVEAICPTTDAGGGYADGSGSVSGRMLTGSSSGSGSSGSGSGGAQHMCATLADMEAVLPTVLVGCVIATTLVGAAFFLLGACRLTGVVGFVPANVTAGFLSCIGWKVMKKALEVASVRSSLSEPQALRTALHGLANRALRTALHGLANRTGAHARIAAQPSHGLCFARRLPRAKK